MQITDMILIAIGLAMDASAVSLVASATGFTGDGRSVFRLAFHFGLFQFLMPLLGWFLGYNFVEYFADFDHWIAFVLLGFVGGRMLLSGLDPRQDGQLKDPSRGSTLVMLSVATSIDALAIGLSIAMLNVAIWYPSLIIGLVTGLLSLLAIAIGKRVAAHVGKKMEIIGGLVLLAIGLRILITHLFFGG